MIESSVCSGSASSVGSREDLLGLPAGAGTAVGSGVGPGGTRGWKVPRRSVQREGVAEPLLSDSDA